MREAADEFYEVVSESLHSYRQELHEKLGRNPDWYLYKPKFAGAVNARYLGAMHVVAAYELSTRDTDGEADFTSAAGDLAAEPLVGLGQSNPDGSHFLLDKKFERMAAKNSISSFTVGLVHDLKSAIRRAPVFPAEDFTEFNRLADRFHEALSHAISDDYYSEDVKQFFDDAVRRTIATKLNHVARLKF